MEKQCSCVTGSAASQEHDTGNRLRLYQRPFGREAARDAVAMAYTVPERFQEMISRCLKLGENRILAGMHLPLDVISGRVQAQAVVAVTLLDPAEPCNRRMRR